MSRSIEPDPVQFRSRRATRSAKWVLALLFVGNLLNFYDRALPSVVLQQIQAEFGANDAQVGLLASAFVLIAALTGVPLGILADRIRRRTVVGVGLLAWSAFTALGGLPGSTFALFLISRFGVGIGESSYSPATSSLIPDLYPPNRRARASSLFSLGFPIGTLLAFFTAGAIATAFGNWRAPFIVAAVPGFVIAILVLRIREPQRGVEDDLPTADGGVPVLHVADRVGIGAVLRTGPLYGLIIAFAGYNFAVYSIGTFLTPVFERHYGLGLVPAAALSGVVIGVMGLLGLLGAGPLLDIAARVSSGRRDLVAAACLAAAAVFSAIGFVASQQALWQLVVFVSLAYVTSIVYLAASVPATADVIRPEQRSTAFGIIFAIGSLLGGAGGPISVGLLSDALAKSSTGLSTSAAAAYGLQSAMAILVPIALAVGALGMVLTVAFVQADAVAPGHGRHRSAGTMAPVRPSRPLGTGTGTGTDAAPRSEGDRDPDR